MPRSKLCRFCGCPMKPKGVKKKPGEYDHAQGCPHSRKRVFPHPQYDEHMDKECVELCDAINLFPGITTFESCCGHEKENFLIWFKAKRLCNLPPILYWLDSCHTGCPGWKVYARTDCGMSPVHFMVEGPVGRFDQATEIAHLMMEYHAENGRAYEPRDSTLAPTMEKASC